MRILRLTVCLVALGLIASPAFATLHMPAIFSDHLVLQSELPACIWGTAEPNSAIRVTFGHGDVHAQADLAGQWIVWFPAQAAGSHGDIIIVSGTDKQTIHDVLFGEVWFASGQSNMEISLHHSQDREKVAARAQRAAFRFFIVQHTIANEPASDVIGKWEIADANNVDHFSATACSFASELVERRHVPVGIVDSSFGGTRLQAWTSQATLESDPRLKYVLDDWSKNLSKLPAMQTAYKAALDKWTSTLNHDDNARDARNAAAPGKPVEPQGPGSKLQPAGLYNGMIAPLTPFTVRGILWYQGENDAYESTEPYRYRILFQAMIESWREAWGDDSLPFIFVQLSRYHGPAYPLLRESQAKALTLSHTAMVVSVDQGTSENVHYPNKEQIGIRLERAAEALAYGKYEAYTPLQPRRVTVDGGSLRVWFSPIGRAPQLRVATIPYFTMGTAGQNTPHVVDGRMILERPPTTEEQMQAIQIAGSNNVFHPTITRVDETSIILSSPEVAHPTQVCYAWSDAIPAVLLWSGEFPITPFRLSLKPGEEPICPPSKPPAESN